MKGPGETCSARGPLTPPFVGVVFSSCVRATFFLHHATSGHLYQAESVLPVPAGSRRHLGDRNRNRSLRFNLLSQRSITTQGPCSGTSTFLLVALVLSPGITRDSDALAFRLQWHDTSHGDSGRDRVRIRGQSISGPPGLAV